MIDGVNVKGVRQDKKIAVYWYRKGAKAGKANAMTSLGLMYERGRGVETKCVKKAVQWYQKGAGAGDARAMGTLGIMYARGRGVEQDYSKSVAWLEKAVAAGNAESAKALTGTTDQGGSGL